MTKRDTNTAEPTPYERFESLTKRLVQVPKKETDEKAEKYQNGRPKKKARRKAQDD